MAVARQMGPGGRISADPAMALGVALVVMLGALASFAAVLNPEATLVAFVASAVVAICAVRADLALLLFVATVPLEATIRISANEQLTLSKLAGALAITSFFLSALATRRRFVFDRTHAMILAIFALATLSTLGAREFDPAASTTLRYASFVALYIVVSQFIGDHVLQRRIAWTLSIASAVAGALALRNFLTGDAGQASLPYTNPNDTAFVLATTLPLAFWLLRGRSALRPVVVLMIAVMSAAIVLSFSRGAFVGLAAAALWELFSLRRRALVLVAGALVATVATVVFVQMNPRQVETGLAHKQKVAEANVESRLDAWRAAIGLAEERPLLGVGPGNFQAHFYEATGRPFGSENLLVVHNAYLDVAAEVGVIAAILFILFVGAVLLRAGAAARGNVGPPGYALAVRSALIVAAVSSLFLSEQYFAPIWLLGGLATALYREREPGASAPE